MRRLLLDWPSVVEQQPRRREGQRAERERERETKLERQREREGITEGQRRGASKRERDRERKRRRDRDRQTAGQTRDEPLFGRMAGLPGCPQVARILWKEVGMKEVEGKKE